VNRLSQLRVIYLLAFALALTAFSACTPETFRRPTLGEARQGKARPAGDTTLQPGEIRAEVLEVDPNRREIRVRTDDGRRETLLYDTVSTKLVYHGWEYPVDNLESGDIIAFPSPRRGGYVDTIRVQEPVQARAGATVGQRSPPPPRPEVLEGTVERIDDNRAAFDVRPRLGKLVTVRVPSNAKASDIDNFRRLRRGDYVRLEGEFVNPDTFELLAFLSSDFDRGPRGR
jgi:hypothetical protein